MQINRDFTRTITDDFKLNVEPRLGSWKEAIPIYFEDTIIAWKIQNIYE